MYRPLYILLILVLLTTVGGICASPQGFTDGNTASNDYAYDANGNVTQDLNKGISSIAYNLFDKPDKITFANGAYIAYTYDATGGKLSQLYSDANGQPTKIDYAGGGLYVNNSMATLYHAEGRYVIPSGSTGTYGGRYQYYLTDHLGSTRAVVGEPGAVATATATFETTSRPTERGQFLRFDNARLVNATLFNHTPPLSSGEGSGVRSYSQRLNATANEREGLARSLSVMPGDKISIEVYAKYVDPNSSNWTSALNTLVSQVASGTANVVVDGGSYASSTSSFPFSGMLNTAASSGNGPKAYLNWLVFDRNFAMKDGGYVRMSDVAREYGQNVPHERLASPELTIAEAGYVYTWLSNENDTPIEVYFDDFAVAHTPSPVVQITDYYPFGMAAYSYVREGEEETREKFQGKELDKNTGLQDFGSRMYDGPTGRWRSNDPKGSKMPGTSNYAAMGNNPVMMVDPDGEFIGTFITGVLDALKTAFVDGGLDVTCLSCASNAWSQYDPTRQGTPTNNAWRIDMGLFQTDPNRNFFGRAWQLISRFTWESPQTVLGNTFSHGRNLVGEVDNVDYWGGATVVNKGHDYNSNNRWGLTLGSYINSKNMRASPEDGLFRHEYGHTLQSMIAGPTYFPSIGIPSFIGSGLDKIGLNNHDTEWYETNANQLAYSYFSKYEKTALSKRPWNFKEYPIAYKPTWYWMFANPIMSPWTYLSGYNANGALSLLTFDWL